MTQPRELLLIDAEAARSESLASRLHLHDDFRATRADSVSQGIDLIGRRRFDAVIIDAEVPDMTPARTIHALQAAANGLAVIVQTRHQNERLVVQALEAGAIDCLPDDTATPVLVARLRAHIRLHDRLESAPLHLGPLIAWPQRRLLTRGEGKPRVQLTEKEMGILRALARAPRNQISRSRLLDKVWRMNRAVETHTVETHIYRLRQKLKALAPGEVRIVTESEGYRLVHDSLLEETSLADTKRRAEPAPAMTI